MPEVTVFTPTYNRNVVLTHLFESLKRQTYKDFEWIIVDDGSTDCTGDVVKGFIDESEFEIRYFYQENNGKHIAQNFAVNKAKGKFFVIMDSDDTMDPDALEKAYNVWNSIKPEKQIKYSAVKSRCYDADSKEMVGRQLPKNPLICPYLDARYKYKVNAEMWSMIRTEVLKEFPSPDIRGGGKTGLRFYPESIWQDKASRKYFTIFVDDATVAYKQSDSNSLIGRGRKYDRYRENIFLWSHIINDNFDYFWYAPLHFAKAFVGMSMDGFFLKKRLSDTLQMVNHKVGKLGVMVFIPAGYLCYRMKK